MMRRSDTKVRLHKASNFGTSAQWFSTSLRAIAIRRTADLKVQGNIEVMYWGSGGKKGHENK